MRAYTSRSPQGYGGPVWTEADHAYLCDNYGKMPAADIAAHLGRTVIAIRGRASRFRLVANHRAPSNSLVRDYFKVIDTPMKAWVLGLLAADGSLSKAGQLRLELHCKDIEIVEAVRDELAPAARISFYQARTTPMCRFMIGGTPLKADLARHGIVNAKSLITAWPADVPAEFINSFICGYYDGDGSLSIGRWPRWAVVSGNPGFLEVMQAEIRQHIGVRVGGPYRDRRHQHAWSIAQVGEPVRALDAWIHRDVPGLARKRLPLVPKSDKAA